MILVHDGVMSCVVIGNVVLCGDIMLFNAVNMMYCGVMCGRDCALLFYFVLM